MTLRPGPDWPRAVLFDLDGTLIDSAPDLHAATNILLSTHGLGPLGLADVTAMIGNGLKKLVERAFAACGRKLSGAALQTEHLRMVEIYGDHLTVLTTLMAGVRETFDALTARGCRIAVVTNKPQMATEAILLHFGLARRVGAAIGGDAGVTKKPAPDMLLAALERLGVEPWDAVMVGDSASDVGAAHAAGIPAVVVRGGYTTVPADRLGAEAVIDSLVYLVDILPRLRAAA